MLFLCFVSMVFVVIVLKMKFPMKNTKRINMFLIFLSSSVERDEVIVVFKKNDKRPILAMMSTYAGSSMDTSLQMMMEANVQRSLHPTGPVQTKKEMDMMADVEEDGIGGPVCTTYILRGLGSNSHRTKLVHGDAEAGGVHPEPGCPQDGEDQAARSQSTTPDPNDEQCGISTSGQECPEVHESSQSTIRRECHGGGPMGFSGHGDGSCGTKQESRASADDAKCLGSLREQPSCPEPDRECGDEAPHREHGQGYVGEVSHEHGEELDAGAWKHGQELRKDRARSDTWPEKEKTDSSMSVMKKKDRKTLQRNIEDILICENQNVHGVFEDVAETEKCEIMSVQLVGDYGVGEVFSMPRVVPAAERKGFRGCKSYDIANGWNFLLADHRAKCREELRRLKPDFLVLSPPCGPFSQILNISKGRCNTEERRRKYLEGLALLEFATELCLEQHKHGRKFLFEHPKGAASWSEECLDRVRNSDGVHEIVTDMCMFGLRDPQNHQKRYRKGTRLLTNSKYGDLLRRLCNGKHDHQHIEGQTRCGCKWVNRSSVAQVYTREFVDAILSVVRRESKDRDVDVLTVDELKSGQNKQQLKNTLLRCHVNLGHPSKERFIHMLKSANASEEGISCAKELTCSTCSANRLKELHHVAKRTRAEGFNQQVNMDTFDLPIYQQKIVKMLSIFCEGTGMQICVPLWKGAKAFEVRKAYRKYWLRWAGVPVKVLTDGGNEFEREAQEGFDRDGTFVEKTAAFSPWQNGACERHGGEWKKIFQKAFDETQPMNKLEVNELIDRVNNAKNTMQRRHGYSPMQHVFGNEIRLPGVAITEQDYVRGTSRYHPGDECLRATEMRLAARKALVEVDNEDKVRRAVQHRTRQHEEYKIGQVVYYWRVTKEKDRRGAWRGPARIIGIHDSSRLWVAHGNKVLRCSPEQVRHVTEEQAAAIRFLPVEAMRQPGRFANRGSQTFTDLTRQARPSDVDHERPADDDEEESRRIKRSRRDEDEEVPMEESQVEEGAVDEESTQDGQDQAMSKQVTSGTETTPEDPSMLQLDIAGSSYGPVRDRHHQHEAPSLTTALRRSTDLLDIGGVRGTNQTGEDVLEVSVLTDDDEGGTLTTSEDKLNMDRCSKHWESFLVSQSYQGDVEEEVLLVQDRRNHELKAKDIQSPEDKRREEAGKRLEWKKLIQTGAVLVHQGERARKIERETEPGRILQSRYVKTRKMCADDPQESEIKCRWVIKGYQDPDLDDLERQSPTLTADGLAVVLQLTASMRWTLQIADVEGAFLQGERLERQHGKIYARLPPCGTPDMDQGAVVELVKCVYGLMDAPLRWWRSITATLKMLGMKQSEMDPCVFIYFHNNQLAGLIALHVDDMVVSGDSHFKAEVTDKLRNKYPFKHWVEKEGNFLGRKLRQQDDFSITIDQKEYANKVKTIEISKERRKQKEESITNKELQQFRGVLGAANWIVGSTRPDIAAQTAMLQQRVSRATVNDLIEANKLVSKIRDFAHVRILVKSIPIEDAMIVVSTDASWSNTDTLGSQAGYFIMMADKKLKENKWADVSPMRWKSYKMERKTQSTLGAELMSVARGIAECDWIRSMMAEVRFPNYELKNDKFFREKLEMMVIVDNKPIYDHVHGEGVIVRDKRIAIDMLLVRRDLLATNAQLRWIDTRQMLSDVFTKINANPDFLMFVLQFGNFIVVKETQSLEWRSRERELKKPRGKSKGP